MTSAAQGRRERGEVTATVLMVPAIIITVLFVVQFALAFYARSVLAGAAHDGAAAGARRGSTAAAGAALTDDLLSQSARALLSSHTASGRIEGDRVVVTAQARVVSLLPFVRGITVRANAAARQETFAGQGAP